MLRELIDNEEFISLFNIRGRKILRTFVTSNEWDKGNFKEQVILVIEWETSKGIICDSITFSYYDNGNYRVVYGLRHNLLMNDMNISSTPLTKTVRNAIAKYFTSFGYSTRGTLWGY